MPPPTDKTIDRSNSYWLKRWQNGDIGWHHEQVNNHLLSHWQMLDVAFGSQVFVPLCGKSRDMVWLAQQGCSVVGVEISSKAIEEFFIEREITPERSRSGFFEIFQAEDYKLLCGDIFQLKPEHIQGISTVYDRASLVALDPRQRQAYAQLLTEILPEKCSILLVAMDYPEAEMPGPPYSVPETEVIELFGDSFSISKLHTLDLLKDTARYAEKGLSRLSEHIYMLKQK